MSLSRPDLWLMVLALSAGCASVSRFVVARRWAFLGEGLGHSVLGGAGTAWLLAVLFPQFARPGVVSLFAILACGVAATGIGWLSRASRLAGDSAIGIVLVGAIAWGFLGQAIYQHRYHMSPIGFEAALFGQIQLVSTMTAVIVAFASGAIVIVSQLAHRELTSYSLDPVLAGVSGVRVNLIHALLIGLCAVLVILAIQVVGTLLVTALLILPAVVTQLISHRDRPARSIEIAVAVVAGGIAMTSHQTMPYLPMGPLLVLALLAMFILAAVARVTANSSLKPTAGESLA